FGLGFLIPFIQLVDWTFLTYKKIADPQFISLIVNSLIVALSGSIIIIIFAIIIANFSRIHQTFISKLSTRVTILGYSIPGAVIAVGIITVFIQLANLLFNLYEAMCLDVSLFLCPSLLMLVSADVIRFLAVGFNAIESRFDKIGNRYTEACRMLGM